MAEVKAPEGYELFENDVIQDSDLQWNAAIQQWLPVATQRIGLPAHIFFVPHCRVIDRTKGVVNTKAKHDEFNEVCLPPGWRWRTSGEVLCKGDLYLLYDGADHIWVTTASVGMTLDSDLTHITPIAEAEDDTQSSNDRPITEDDHW